MNRAQILCFVFCVTLCSSMAGAGQDESLLESRIAQALKDKEPCWKPIAVIESGRVPLVPSEKRILVATYECEQLGGAREGVNVSIYSVENTEQATEWLRPIRSKQVAPGWRISSYHIGDEAYLAKYKAGERFEIEFRKGRVVGKVAANDLARLDNLRSALSPKCPLQRV